MNYSKIFKEISGARHCEWTEEAQTLYVWHGDSTIDLYDRQGLSYGVLTVGKPEAEQVKAAIEAHISAHKEHTPTNEPKDDRNKLTIAILEAITTLPKGLHSEDVITILKHLDKHLSKEPEPQKEVDESPKDYEAL